MNLLFDFLLNHARGKGGKKRTAVAADSRTSSTKRTAGRPSSLSRSHAARKARYAGVVEELLTQHNIHIKRWRKNTSGCAWLVRYTDGSTKRWLESPYPTGPVSCAVFLHEVGHHAIGLGVHTPRCLEEHLAWQWALREMEARGLTITDAVRTRVQRSMKYAVSKAMRRGLKRLPDELRQYL